MFKLGQLYMTIGIQESDGITSDDIMNALRRYIKRDWGDLVDEDKQLNDLVVENGERIIAAYHSQVGVRFYVITEWDRSTTTILLPDEY